MFTGWKGVKSPSEASSLCMAEILVFISLGQRMKCGYWSENTNQAVVYFFVLVPRLGVHFHKISPRLQWYAFPVVNRGKRGGWHVNLLAVWKMLLCVGGWMDKVLLGLLKKDVWAQTVTCLTPAVPRLTRKYLTSSFAYVYVQSLCKK